MRPGVSMVRFAVLLLLFLAGCAAQSATSCLPAGAADCPVYKAPEDGASCHPCAVAATAPAPLALPPGFQPWAEGFDGDMRFVVGDGVKITLPYYPEETTTTTVAPDGNLYIGLLGPVPAAGRTPADLAAELKRRYSRYLRFPDVGVVPTGFESRLVYVGGEVDKPGAYPLKGPTGALEAIFAAGGFRDTANRGEVVLIRRGPNDLPMLRILDLKSFAADGTPSENTLLRPFDIVVVPKSAIAKLNLFISQYVEQVVPFNQNFSYVILNAGH